MLNALLIFSWLLVMGNTGLDASQADKPKAEINLNLIETKQFVTAHETDSLFYASSDENRKLEWGATSFYILKSGGEIKLIKYFSYEDSYTVKHKIIDLDHDGINEVVCIDMDEEYFSFTIYKAKFIGSNFVIEIAFTKKSLYSPLVDMPNADFGLMKILSDEHNDKKLRLYYGTDDQKIKSFDVFYDKRKHRFVEK